MILRNIKLQTNLTDKAILGPHRPHDITSFFNRIINKYNLYKPKTIRFPFLYLLKSKFSHYYKLENIMNISLEAKIHSRIIPKQKIEKFSPNMLLKSYTWRVNVEKTLNFYPNTFGSKTYKKNLYEPLIKNFFTNMLLKSYISQNQIKNTLNFPEKSLSTDLYFISKTKPEALRLRGVLASAGKAFNPTLAKGNTALPLASGIRFPASRAGHIIGRKIEVSHINITEREKEVFHSLGKKNIPAIQQNIFLDKRTEYIKPPARFMETKKAELIFFNPNKQLDVFKHSIQKQIKKQQSKEEIISVTTDNSKDTLKSKDLQKMADQMYKLIMKRWQKDLERRGIFHA
jgi:hypothetical protein